MNQGVLKTIVQIVRDHDANPRGNLILKVRDACMLSYWGARTALLEARQAMESSKADIGVDPRDPVFRSEALRLLRKPTTVDALAAKLHTRPDEIQTLLVDLEERGYIVNRAGLSISLGRSVQHQEARIDLGGHLHGDPLTFGVVADMHMGSNCERLDVLNTAYDTFEGRGITTVLCPGNYVDGESRHNTHELKVRGIADQAQYCIDHWPHKPGIKTFYVDGDDHEGWYQQREGIEFGRYLMLEAQAQSRDDLVYMGYMEADIALYHGGGESTIKVIHAGGGSSYALSYTSQKLAESLQSGEKPDVVIIGHYHKMDYCMPRGIHCLQAGCCQDQTRFMRKKKLAAHVGFCIVTLQQDGVGGISRFVPEFYPFWDRGYYSHRGHGAGERLTGGA